MNPIQEQKLLEMNSSETPFEDCHYFQWLYDHGDEKGNRVKNTVNYLDAVGLKLMTDPELMRNLKFIHNHFYWLKWKAGELESSLITQPI